MTYNSRLGLVYGLEEGGEEEGGEQEDKETKKDDAAKMPVVCYSGISKAEHKWAKESALLSEVSFGLK